MKYFDIENHYRHLRAGPQNIKLTGIKEDVTLKFMTKTVKNKILLARKPENGKP